MFFLFLIDFRNVFAFVFVFVFAFALLEQASFIEGVRLSAYSGFLMQKNNTRHMVLFFFFC